MLNLEISEKKVLADQLLIFEQQYVYDEIPNEMGENN